MLVNTKVKGEAKDDEIIRETNLQWTWLDLPLDIVDLIATRLVSVDRFRFRMTCKSWYFTLASPCVPEVGERPWPMLMYLANDCEGKCKFFDPIMNKIGEHAFYIPTHGRLTLHCAKNGWMIMTDEDEDGTRIFFINIFSLEKDIIILPFVTPTYLFHGICWSSPPTNSNCVVIGILGGMTDNSTIEIYLWRHGQESWNRKRYKNNIPFIRGYSNPVFHKGLFYCLGINGNLGIFDPTVEKWTILDKPKPIYQMKEDITEDALVMNVLIRCDRDECCYLMESFNGYLLSIFDYSNGKPLLIMKLDESKMTWNKLDDLEDEILFLDVRNSISIPAPLKKLENRIYFTRFLCDDTEHNEGVYYSLTSKIYYNNPKYKLKEKVNRAWIMSSI